LKIKFLNFDRTEPDMFLSKNIVPLASLVHQQGNKGLFYVLAEGP